MSILSIPIDQVSILEEQTIASWTPPSPSISMTHYDIIVMSLLINRPHLFQREEERYFATATIAA